MHFRSSYGSTTGFEPVSSFARVNDGQRGHNYKDIMALWDGHCEFCRKSSLPKLIIIAARLRSNHRVQTVEILICVDPNRVCVDKYISFVSWAQKHVTAFIPGQLQVVFQLLVRYVFFAFPKVLAGVPRRSALFILGKHGEIKPSVGK